MVHGESSLWMLASRLDDDDILVVSGRLNIANMASCSGPCRFVLEETDPRVYNTTAEEVQMADSHMKLYC